MNALFDSLLAKVGCVMAIRLRAGKDAHIATQLRPHPASNRGAAKLLSVRAEKSNSIRIGVAGYEVFFWFSRSTDGSNEIMQEYR